MRKMRWRNPEAARHNHDQRIFSACLAVISHGEEKLAVDGDFRQVGGMTDDVKVVDRVGGGNVEALTLAAVSEDDVGVAKSQSVILLRGCCAALFQNYAEAE